jgi:5-formyltetrahydrofolate cyclo-ligase
LLSKLLPNFVCQNTIGMNIDFFRLLFPPFKVLFTTKQEKKRIRNEIRHLKYLLTEEEKEMESEKVFSKIELMQEFKNSNSILLYWSTNDELPTHSIIKKWSVNKFIILPAIKGNDLVLKQYTLDGKMKQHTLGIWEPDLMQTFTGKLDLIIVPGVAFDKNKKRLGRGKGYYDRFLTQYKALKIGIGFDFQLLDLVPTNRFDLKMNKIITPSFTIE